ncbi:glycosyltransferase family 25 protein [Rhodovulum sp. DZ06]|uniref:glycosyltransferase family 25 protein n=1 Tax=Rhodovulum sp. DZ06 TaxID=3425126 RepID=UPI003D34FE48
MSIGAALLQRFERIYIINLASRTDRRAEMAGQLGRIGLTFDTPGVRLFAAIRPDGPGEFPSVGAHGCFMSHLSILEEARADGLASVLILEDDLNFSNAFMANADAYMAILDAEPFAFLHGGSPLPDPSAAAPTPLRLAPDEPMMTTHCIALRGAAIADCADYLAAMAARKGGDPAGGPMHVDGAYCWFRRARPDLAGLSFSPSMAYQRLSDTDVAPQAAWKSLPVVKQLLGLRRRIRNALRAR